MKNELFTYSDIYGLTQEEFGQTMDSLISNQIIESIIDDNQIKYRFTTVGLQVGQHLISNKSNQN